MEPRFQKTFIPKETFGPAVARKRVAGSGILAVLAFVVFLTTVALSVGAFLYTQYLKSSLERKEASLTRAREAFDPQLIEELTRLNDRLKLAKQVLGTHVAPSQLFDLLEKGTLESVRFSDLRYTVLDNGQITVFMSGVGRTFNAVALQSDIFGKTPYIKDPIFSDLSLDDKGNVEFDFNAVLDPTLLTYQKSLTSVPVAPPVETPEEPEETATPQL